MTPEEGILMILGELRAQLAQAQTDRDAAFAQMRVLEQKIAELLKGPTP